MLVIDPEECIDCNLCVPECPVNAIYADHELPDDQQHFIAINAEYSTSWPVISIKKAEPVDAQDWDAVKEKYSDHFDPEPGSP